MTTDTAPLRRPDPFVWALTLSVGMVAISLAVQGPATAFLSEQGGVEIAAILCLIGGAVLLAAGTVRAMWHLPALLVLFALRERDFHDWFFDPGLLHADMLTSDAPLWQRAVSLAVMLFILAVLVRTVWFGARPLLRGLWHRAGWAWTLTIGTALAAGSTLLDGAGRKLAPYGIDLSREVQVALGGVEELAELVFALLLILSIRLWSGDRV
jgi:hypothetical protein